MAGDGAARDEDREVEEAGAAEEEAELFEGAGGEDGGVGFRLEMGE